MTDTPKELPSTGDERIEAVCRAWYGKHWDGPAEKMPGEKMKEVWRDLARKADTAISALSGMEAARAAAIEEAARVADARVKVADGYKEKVGLEMNEYQRGYNDGCRQDASIIALTLRALSSRTPTQDAHCPPAGGGDRLLQIFQNNRAVNHVGAKLHRFIFTPQQVTEIVNRLAATPPPGPAKPPSEEEIRNIIMDSLKKPHGQSWTQLAARRILSLFQGGSDTSKEHGR